MFVDLALLVCGEVPEVHPRTHDDRVERVVVDVTAFVTILYFCAFYVRPLAPINREFFTYSRYKEINEWVSTSIV